MGSVMPKESQQIVREATVCMECEHARMPASHGPIKLQGQEQRPLSQLISSRHHVAELGAVPDYDNRLALLQPFSFLPLL